MICGENAAKRENPAVLRCFLASEVTGPHFWLWIDGYRRRTCGSVPLQRAYVGPVAQASRRSFKCLSRPTHLIRSILTCRRARPAIRLATVRHRTPASHPVLPSLPSRRHVSWGKASGRYCPAAKGRNTAVGSTLSRSAPDGARRVSVRKRRSSPRGRCSARPPTCT